MWYSSEIMKAVLVGTVPHKVTDSNLVLMECNTFTKLHNTNTLLNYSVMQHFSF